MKMWTSLHKEEEREDIKNEDAQRKQMETKNDNVKRKRYDGCA